MQQLVNIWHRIMAHPNVISWHERNSSRPKATSNASAGPASPSFNEAELDDNDLMDEMDYDFAMDAYYN
jgi:hypothetical protein